MTDREKAIVMAYTGVAMLVGDKLDIFYKYLAEILGRPVFTHELATQEMTDEIKKKSKPDFIKLCRETIKIYPETTEPIRHGHWVFDYFEEIIQEHIYHCSICGSESFYETHYCSNCGAKMDEEVEE